VHLFQILKYFHAEKKLDRKTTEDNDYRGNEVEEAIERLGMITKILQVFIFGSTET
jgi:hypothetical protein